MAPSAATKLFTVRRKVVDLLAADPALGDALVAYGWPGSQHKQRQMVYTDARATGTQTPAGMRSGRTYYNERAKFDVSVFVEGVGLTQQETDDAAEALSLAVAEVIADNRTLDDVVNWVVSTGWVNDSAWNDQGYVALLTYTFEYDARLN